MICKIILFSGEIKIFLSPDNPIEKMELKRQLNLNLYEKLKLKLLINKNPQKEARSLIRNWDYFQN